MLKILTGFAVIKDIMGDRVSFTYVTVDENGKIIDDNKKESFVVLEEEDKSLIVQLENKIKERLV